MWLVQGRGQLLASVLAVVVACCFGCGGDDGDGGSGNNPGNNGGNNGGGNADYVTLGGKKWMKKNLNVETADSSWCYDNDASNCAKYGRLYTWESAKLACQSVGMRLPDTADWNRLMTAVGGSSTVGKKLKATSGWGSNASWNGTDDYGFSALPGGRRLTDGYFNGAGNYGDWWTATEHGSGYAYYRYMYYYRDLVNEGTSYEGFGLSVRCVRD
jgi:uncharacterized protein (TIGR02145 family)